MLKSSYISVNEAFFFTKRPPARPPPKNAAPSQETLDKSRKPRVRCVILDGYCVKDGTMKVKNSLKTWKVRDRNSKLVRRRGRIYIINKRNPRMKGRQG